MRWDNAKLAGFRFGDVPPGCVFDNLGSPFERSRGSVGVAMVDSCFRWFWESTCYCEGLASS